MIIINIIKTVTDRCVNGEQLEQECGMRAAEHKRVSNYDENDKPVTGSWINVLQYEWRKLE